MVSGLDQSSQQFKHIVSIILTTWCESSVPLKRWGSGDTQKFNCLQSHMASQKKKCFHSEWKNEKKKKNGSWHTDKRNGTTHTFLKQFYHKHQRVFFILKNL